MTQIAFIPKKLELLIGDIEKKPKLPVSLRYFLLPIFGSLFWFFLVFSIIYLTNKRIGLGLIFLVLCYLSLILVNWFEFNHQELIRISLKKIGLLNKEDRFDDIIDEVDELIDNIDDITELDENEFNLTMFKRLRDYLALFVYPALNMSIPIKEFVYSELFLNLKPIFNQKNNLYKIPELLDRFDSSFLKEKGVESTLCLYYEKETSFFKESITKRILELKKEINEKTKGTFTKIYEFAKENPLISGPIILFVLSLITNYYLGIKLPINQ